MKNNTFFEYSVQCWFRYQIVRERDLDFGIYIRYRRDRKDSNKSLVLRAGIALQLMDGDKRTE
jgi:hypothetical protein